MDAQNVFSPRSDGELGSVRSFAKVAQLQVSELGNASTKSSLQATRDREQNPLTQSIHAPLPQVTKLSLSGCGPAFKTSLGASVTSEGRLSRQVTFGEQPHSRPASHASSASAHAPPSSVQRSPPSATAQAITLNPLTLPINLSFSARTLQAHNPYPHNGGESGHGVGDFGANGRFSALSAEGGSPSQLSASLNALAQRVACTRSSAAREEQDVISLRRELTENAQIVRDLSSRLSSQAEYINRSTAADATSTTEREDRLRQLIKEKRALIDEEMNVIDRLAKENAKICLLRPAGAAFQPQASLKCDAAALANEIVALESERQMLCGQFNLFDHLARDAASEWAQIIENQKLLIQLRNDHIVLRKAVGDLPVGPATSRGPSAPRAARVSSRPPLKAEIFKARNSRLRLSEIPTESTFIMSSPGTDRTNCAENPLHANLSSKLKGLFKICTGKQEMVG